MQDRVVIHAVHGGHVLYSRRDIPFNVMGSVSRPRYFYLPQDKFEKRYGDTGLA